jgi:hypothetical protein
MELRALAAAAGWDFSRVEPRKAASMKCKGVLSALAGAVILASRSLDARTVVWDGRETTSRDWARALSGAEVAADMRFEFKGLFAPVDNPPVVNVAKAGSSVPVKWGLSG